MRLNAILIAATTALLLQQPRVASIEGIVVKVGTADPVAKAVVELKTNDGNVSSAIATAADGKFKFRNLAPGSYRLTVSRSGYLDSAFGQRGSNSSARPLVVADGQAVSDIRLIMVPTGAISGRVYDKSGEPLTNISVRAFKYSYADGQRTLKRIKTVETNDRGEYRLFWLPPGLYYIAAVGQAGGREAVVTESDGKVVPRAISPAEKLGETYVPTYYPGTADPQSATPVELRPGTDFGGIDFALDQAPARTISGIVLDSRGQAINTALAGQNPYVNLPGIALVTRSGGPIVAPPRSSASLNGTFTIKDVLPGSYFLVVTRYMNSGGDTTTFSGTRVPIDVQGNVDRLSIVLPPAVSISGQITIEGARDKANDLPPHLDLKSELPGIPPTTTRYTDGIGKQFSLDGVIEGDYQVEVTRLPEGTYVKSVRFGAADALNGGLHIDSRNGGDRIEVVLGADGGALDGIVFNKDREPVASATVALVPNASRRQRADLYRSVAADESGRFHLQGIAPGDYVLFAWEDIEEGLWRDSEFIRRSESSGKPIHILEGSHGNAEVTAVPFAF